MPEINAHRSEDVILAEDFRLLESLDGFLKLTPKQQRLIKLSLYVQNRAVRADQGVQISTEMKKYFGIEMDEVIAEKELYTAHKLSGGPDPDLISNKSSRDHVANWYCHLAAYVLEAGDLNLADSDIIPDDFFETDYSCVNDYHEIEEMITVHGFPCLIHIGNPDADYFEKAVDRIAHTCLALGKDSNGQVIIWEKVNEGLPYRLITLKDVYDFYSENNFNYKWGVRSLK